MKRIAVLGTINHDRIIAPDGAEHEDLGGILYNVLTLAPYAGPDVTIVPAARLGNDAKGRTLSLLAPHRNVDPSRLLWSDRGTNETVLRYCRPDERDETLIERIEPLREEEIRFAAECDVLLVNLIWGKELTPALLRAVAPPGAPVVLDIQSLTLTFRGGPDRGYRNVAAWREWAEGASVIKGNEQEMRWFAGDGGPFRGDLRDLARSLLNAGPGVAIVTLGTEGFLAAWREGEGARFARVPAVPVPAAACVDTTGCGDAFTSGYVLGMMRGETPLEACLLGASLAALVCRTRGMDGLLGLGDPFALRAEAYGDLLPPA